VTASNKDIASMMKLLDKKSLGYLTFADFSKVFSPSMSSNLVKIEQNDNYIPFNQPSLEIYEMQQTNQFDMNKKLETIRDGLKPDQDPSKYKFVSLLPFPFSELVPPTRFSAQPNFSSTFVNFQQDKTYPGFISEKDRVGGRRGMNSTTNAAEKKSAHSVFSATVANNLNAKISFQFEDKLKAT